MSQFWASRGVSGRAVQAAPPCCRRATAGKGSGLRGMGRRPATSALGFHRTHALFQVFSKSLACGRGWRELFEDPTMTRASNLLYGIRVPRGDGSGWGEAGSSPRSSRLTPRPSCTWSPGLRSRVWVRPSGTQRKRQGGYHSPHWPHWPAGGCSGPFPPCPLAARPGAGLLPDYLSRNFYCKPAEAR